MKNSHFKTIATALFVTAFAFNSCEKDVTEIETEQKETVLTGGLEKNSVVIDGKKMEWNFSLRPRKLTKGMLLDEASYYESIMEDLRGIYGDDYKLIDTLRFTYKNQNYETKLLRVDRKSAPGKYFYVMIDNLDVKIDTACWAYGDNESNVKKYGRLYTWDAANALAKGISMRLPIYDVNNPTQKKFGGRLQLPVKARLLSCQDILDILECDALGNLPENGYALDEHIDCTLANLHAENPLFYYDVFVGGLEGPTGNGIDYFRGEHTLGGLRNPERQPEWAWPFWNGDGWYTRINGLAMIWTLEGYEYAPKPWASHFPLEIARKINDNVYEYSAYINCLHSNMFGYSVRYVFEPQYK